MLDKLRPIFDLTIEKIALHICEALVARSAMTRDMVLEATVMPELGAKVTTGFEMPKPEVVASGTPKALTPKKKKPSRKPPPNTGKGHPDRYFDYDQIDLDKLRELVLASPFTQTELAEALSVNPHNVLNLLGRARKTRYAKIRTVTGLMELIEEDMSLILNSPMTAQQEEHRWTGMTMANS